MTVIISSGPMILFNKILKENQKKMDDNCKIILNVLAAKIKELESELYWANSALEGVRAENAELKRRLERTEPAEVRNNG